MFLKNKLQEKLALEQFELGDKNLLKQDNSFFLNPTLQKVYDNIEPNYSKEEVIGYLKEKKSELKQSQQVGEKCEITLAIDAISAAIEEINKPPTDTKKETINFDKSIRMPPPKPGQYPDKEKGKIKDNFKDVNDTDAISILYLYRTNKLDDADMEKVRKVLEDSSPETETKSETETPKDTKSAEGNKEIMEKINDIFTQAGKDCLSFINIKLCNPEINNNLLLPKVNGNAQIALS